MPILVKGSNWVPADAFHSRDAGRYEKILALFVDLECNMLRSWGGNVYEDDAFFEICDRNGIMVWQDFAMACAIYPQTPEFLEVMRQEAISVVRKLRNHPSLALWSGDNEVDVSYYFNGLDPAHNKITREVLPQVVFQCDPYRPYLPSSPYMSPEVIATGLTKLMPEDHLWGPRDYFKSSFYTEHTAHFVSEIGYHGCPGLSSIKRFVDEQHVWPWQRQPPVGPSFHRYVGEPVSHPADGQPGDGVVRLGSRRCGGLHSGFPGFPGGSQEVLRRDDAAQEVAEHRPDLVECHGRLAAVFGRHRGLLLQQETRLLLHSARAAARLRHGG